MIVANCKLQIGGADRATRAAARGAVFALVAAFCLVVSAGPLSAQFHTQPQTGPAPQVSSKLLLEAGIDQKLDAQLPLELQFRNSDGAPVRLGDLLGDKPAILQLVYYECPMLCKLATDGLVRTLKSLSFSAGNEFEVLTVSFDPDETVRLSAAARRATLKRYGRGPEAAAGWHFLTGSEDAIRRLTETAGFRYTWDPTLGQYVHGAGIIILTPEGRISRYLNGVEYPARDVRLALVEASDLKIATPTDQALLLCYQYNPSIGRYGWRIQRVIEVLGFITTTAIVGTIVVLLRRERRRQSAGSVAARHQSSASGPSTTGS